MKSIIISYEIHLHDDLLRLNLQIKSSFISIKSSFRLRNPSFSVQNRTFAAGAAAWSFSFFSFFSSFSAASSRSIASRTLKSSILSMKFSTFSMKPSHSCMKLAAFTIHQLYYYYETDQVSHEPTFFARNTSVLLGIFEPTFLVSCSGFAAAVEFWYDLDASMDGMNFSGSFLTPGRRKINFGPQNHHFSSGKSWFSLEESWFIYKNSRFPETRPSGLAPRVAAVAGILLVWNALFGAAIHHF